MKNEITDLLSRPNVVAVIADWEDYLVAKQAPVGSIDIVEFRADKYPYDIEHERSRAVFDLGLPIIFTPRDASERGGRADWTLTDRASLYHRAMRYPKVVLIDVELVLASRYIGIIQAAHKRELGVVLSSHDFVKTPSIAEVINWARACRRLDGDVLKMAFTANDDTDRIIAQEAPRTLRRLNFPFKVAGMLMGEGSESQRYADARDGSPLIYTWLSSRIPGQPQAIKAKQEFEAYCQSHLQINA